MTNTGGAGCAAIKGCDGIGKRIRTSRKDIRLRSAWIPETISLQVRFLLPYLKSPAKSGVPEKVGLLSIMLLLINKGTDLGHENSKQIMV